MRTIVYAILFAVAGAVFYYLSAELGIATSRRSSGAVNQGDFEVWKMLLVAFGGLLIGGISGYRSDKKKGASKNN